MISMDQRIGQDQLREDIPAFRPGDTIRVNVRVREGEKERLQEIFNTSSWVFTRMLEKSSG